MTALQRKYFAPRRRRAVAKKMPRRRRHSYRRSRGGGGKRGIGGIFRGKLGGLIAGAAAGLLGSTLAGRVPYAAPISMGAVGYFAGNETLMTLAGMQVATLIPNPLGSGTAGSGAGPYV